jgi:hypothetical protein
MIDNGQRVIAETVFQREETGERKPGDALKLEEARREATVENMRRLRALRLAQNAKSNSRAAKKGAPRNA